MNAVKDAWELWRLMFEDGQHFLKTTILKLEKDGNHPAEYEDATAVKHVQTGLRLALADGATAAIFAGAWAQMLVGRFVWRPFWTTAGLAYPVRTLGRQWSQKHAQKDLPWYLAKKLERGAAATLIGVRISMPERRTAAGTWRAISIGDACLFHIQGSKLVQMHPELKPAEFGNNPALIYTDTSRNQRLAQGPAVQEGSWQWGDIFVVASDALARWIRLSMDGGQREWEGLLALAGNADREAAFRSWARHEQGNGRLKNDDLTMVLCMS